MTLIAMLTPVGYLLMGLAVFFGSAFFKRGRDADTGDIVFICALWPILIPLFALIWAAKQLDLSREYLIDYNSAGAKRERQVKRLEKKQAKQLPAPAIKIETGPVDYRHGNCHACGQVVK